MSDALDNLIEKIALEGKSKQLKMNDKLVLADAVLQSALERSHPLNRSEYQALLDSPLTMRRLQILANQHRADAAAKLSSTTAPTTQSTTQPTTTTAYVAVPSAMDSAANASSYWAGSDCILRAADSATVAPTLRTEDGWWCLVFVASATGWRMILQLDPSAPFAAALLAEHKPVQALDGQKRVLLQGVLDLDGELEAAWPFEQTPFTLLVAAGSTLRVEPA